MRIVPGFLRKLQKAGVMAMPLVALLSGSAAGEGDESPENPSHQIPAPSSRYMETCKQPHREAQLYRSRFRRVQRHHVDEMAVGTRMLEFFGEDSGESNSYR
jgi:hypothetical protein